MFWLSSLAGEHTGYIAQTTGDDEPYFGTVHVQRENPEIMKVSSWPKEFQC